MKDLETSPGWTDRDEGSRRAARRAGWSKAALHCNLRDIAIFVAAYEERSFTAAAQRENATQSGVSQHMRNLEQFLGVQLFLRERDGVLPTPAAAAFYRHCLKILHAHAVARAEVARFSGGPCAVLRVGLPAWMTARVLGPALRQLVDEAPNATIHVTEGTDVALRQMVRAGEIDVAVVPDFGKAPGLRCRPLARSREVLVTGRPGHEGGAPVRLPELGPLHLVLPGPADSRRRAIEEYLCAQGAEPAGIIELDSLAGALDFVAGTDWMTILPELMLPEIDTGRTITRHPISEPPLWIDLVAVEPARRPLSELGLRLLEVVATVIDRTATGGAASDDSPRRLAAGRVASPPSVGLRHAAAMPGAQPPAP